MDETEQRRQKRVRLAMIVAGWPLFAAALTVAAFLSARLLPPMFASPFDAFLAFVVLAAFNAILAAAVPTIATAWLSEGRVAGRVAGAVACGAVGLLVYVLAGLIAWNCRIL
jgi:hypothetical protein